MLNKTAMNKIIKKHFTVSHRKTSNVDLCLLNFIFSCRFFDIKDYLLSLKKKIASFQFAGILPQYHLRLDTVKFSNRSVQEAICKTRNDESGNGMRGMRNGGRNALAEIPEREGSISPSTFYGQPPDYQSHVFCLVYQVDVGSMYQVEMRTWGQSRISSSCISVWCESRNQDAGGVQDSPV